MTEERINRGGLVAGVLFLVIGLAFLLGEIGLIEIPLSLFLPIALVLAGLALLASAWTGDDDGA
jgi:hypothetical protein